MVFIRQPGLQFFQVCASPGIPAFFFTIEKHGLTTVFKFSGQFFNVLMLVVGDCQIGSGRGHKCVPPCQKKLRYHQGRPLMRVPRRR